MSKQKASTVSWQLCMYFVFLPILLKKALIWQGGYDMKRYIVELTSQERSHLQQIVSKGNTSGYRI